MKSLHSTLSSSVFPPFLASVHFGLAIAIFAGNHTAYKQMKGTKATAKEILQIYEGLKQSYLTDFDVLLSGYAPGAEAVNAIGAIAKDLESKRDSLFWGTGNVSHLPVIA